MFVVSGILDAPLPSLKCWHGYGLGHRQGLLHNSPQQTTVTWPRYLNFELLLAIRSGNNKLKLCRDYGMTVHCFVLAITDLFDAYSSRQENPNANNPEGTIGHDLVLKPVPASVRQHLDDDEMFLDSEGEDISEDVAVGSGFPLRRSRRSAAVAHRHIVFKRDGAHDDTLGDYAFMEPDHLAKKYRSKRSISKREAPYVIYPEILVIVDYDGYRLHGGDNVQIKRYFVSFWNGVDLRYKLLKGPKIRISIAGIIISRGRDATPYLERNRVGRDAIDSAAALTDMGKYLFRERRLPVYDIAVAVTKLQPLV
uniref:Uncharacterized protein n=1 Tax=Timema bartmani TaxID=61472 RepID=A0A7R9EMJ3_9NEOP|nr:unnamed protein product [Timema bartmani]